ncbi:MAG TPA: hypothetical protein VMZ24_05550 [Patescibacteria group bacterium]|nr:hypothetical protein [Patescibacteria group bacterium]
MTPIYRSDGEWVAVYLDGYLFNVDCEWIGFVSGREAFDTAGQYLGFISDDRRLLRKRSLSRRPPRLVPPERPANPNLPASMPLAPMLRQLPHHIIDVFEEFPDRLTYISETRPDMD